jgi:hypothetical protein
MSVMPHKVGKVVPVSTSLFLAPDVKTRWNSTHAKFARFIKLKLFLIELLAKEEWSKKVKTKL